MSAASATAIQILLRIFLPGLPRELSSGWPRSKNVLINVNQILEAWVSLRSKN